MPVELNCEHCGEVFEVKPCRKEEAKYCSQSCYGDAQERDESRYDTYTCQHCGEEFEGRKDRTNNYCSNECNISSQRDRVQLTCPVCGDDFEVEQAQSERRRCCSRECYGKWRTENIVGEEHPNHVKPVTVTCDYCGEKIERNKSRVEPYDTQFCDHSCYSQYMSTIHGEEHPLWQGGEEYNYGQNWEEQREKRLERDDYECVVCGIADEEHKEETGQGLHVHHIKPRRDFLKENGELDYEEANKITNLITLCNEHHRKWEGIPLRPQRQ